MSNTNRTSFDDDNGGNDRGISGGERSSGSPGYEPFRRVSVCARLPGTGPGIMSRKTAGPQSRQGSRSTITSVDRLPGPRLGSVLERGGRLLSRRDDNTIRQRKCVAASYPSAAAPQWRLRKLQVTTRRWPKKLGQARRHRNGGVWPPPLLIVVLLAVPYRLRRHPLARRRHGGGHSGRMDGEAWRPCEARRYRRRCRDTEGCDRDRNFRNRSG